MGPRRADFAAFAVVLGDRMIVRTPYNQEFIESIKQIPSQLRMFIKDGRPLERALRTHLEANEEYFSSHEDLAAVVDSLVNSIARAGGLSDSWAIALAVPEVFEWALAAALKAFPDLQLYDVRVLDEGTDTGGAAPPGS